MKVDSGGMKLTADDLVYQIDNIVAAIQRLKRDATAPVHSELCDAIDSLRDARRLVNEERES